jgi:hypothetical protein
MRDQGTRAIRAIAVLMGLLLATLPNASVAGDVPASKPTASAAELFIVTMLLAAATSARSGMDPAAAAAPREARLPPASKRHGERPDEQNASIY